jgi:hypothetical protein
MKGIFNYKNKNYYVGIIIWKTKKTKTKKKKEGRKGEWGNLIYGDHFPVYEYSDENNPDISYCAKHFHG